MAEPLILLPTLMADARPYLGVINAQLPKRSVFVHVPKGEGSLADWAQRLLAEAPARFCLMGHGLGALLAIEVALAAPDRVTRLVLVGGAAQTELPAVVAAHEPLLVKAQSGSLGAAVLEFSGVSAMPVGPDRDSLEELVLAMAFDLGSDLFVQQIRAVQRRGDRQSRLRKIVCPTLVLAAEMDPVFPARQLDLMAHMLPNATMHQIKGTGFWLPAEMPARLTELVSDFLPEPLVLR